MQFEMVVVKDQEANGSCDQPKARNGDRVCAYIIMNQDQIHHKVDFKSMYMYLVVLPYILSALAQLGCLYIFVQITIYIICID